MLRALFFTMLLMLLLVSNIIAQNPPNPTATPIPPTITTDSVDRWRSGTVNDRIANNDTSKLERGRILVITLKLSSAKAATPTVPEELPVSVTEADAWLDFYKQNPDIFATVLITIENTAQKINFPITRLLVSCKRPPASCAQTNFTAGFVKIYLELNQTLPKEAFTVELDFGRVSLSPNVVFDQKAKEVKELYAQQNVEDLVSPPPPEEKNLERNLELGLAFTSAVEDEEVPATTTTPATTVRKRNNRGVLDLTFAPWLDVLKPVIERNKALWFWTPGYIKANVATGKIEKDTLSLNRILLGTNFEMRYYRSRGGKLSTPTTGWVTLNLGLIHASDRDFKQKEIYANAEFKPVWKKLFKPYALNYTIERVNGKGIKRQKPWGLTVEPLIGFAFGRTYSRRNPAEAIKSKDTFSRLYLGGTASLSVKDRFIFTAEDKYYIRSETSFDRYANYSKLTGEFRLGSNRYFSNGIFASFEKGTDAPFTSYVNSFRVGYRLWGNWCQPFCR